jgi:hypothetical protein
VAAYSLTDVAFKFEKHGFETLIFEKKRDVVDWLNTEFKGVQTLGRSSSVTLDALGFDDIMSGQGIKIFNHVNSKPENKREVLHAANNSDVYFLSANAVTADGLIFNVDASGNRVSAMTFGPKKVIYIIGKNKIVDDAEQAFLRLKKIAGPRNALRINKKNGCALNHGICVDCNSSERICNAYLILARAPWSIDKSMVVFVNEDLGF